MPGLTCAETATLLGEVSAVGCRSPWEREMVKLALLNRVIDGIAVTATNAASYSSVRSISATDAVLSTDSIILADATSAAITVNLPPAAISNGRVFVVKRVNSGANAVTVDASGAETIDGAGTYALSSQWAVVRVASNGTAWFTV